MPAVRQVLASLDLDQLCLGIRTFVQTHECNSLRAVFKAGGWTLEGWKQDTVKVEPDVYDLLNKILIVLSDIRRRLPEKEVLA